MKKTKDFKFEIKDANVDSDKTLGFISGLASTFGNIDRQGDRIEEGAFAKSLGRLKRQKKTVPILASHQFESVIGGVKASNLRETEEGLFMKEGAIDLNTQKGREFYSLAKNGFLDSFSIGFSVPKDGMEMGSKFNKIKEIDLMEISLVPVPANPKATISDVKAVSPTKNFAIAPDDTDWDGSEAVKAIKEDTGSEDSPSASYKNGFFWYDEKNADDFGSYKMPFVDKIGGELKIVPKGVFAAAAAMQGARGGVKIPDSDKSAVKSKIEACYKRMGRSSPFVNNDDKGKEDKKHLLQTMNDNIMIMKLFKYSFDQRLKK